MGEPVGFCLQDPEIDAEMCTLSIGGHRGDRPQMTINIDARSVRVRTVIESAEQADELIAKITNVRQQLWGPIVREQPWGLIR